MIHAKEIKLIHIKNLEAIMSKPKGSRSGQYHAKSAEHYIQRFMSFVDICEDNCWIWTARKNERGYGQFSLQRRPRGAHRVAYQIAYGDIKPDLIVMHKCDNPSCVNPEHLELGNQSQNIKDCVKRGRHPEANKQVCKNGHDFTPQNTYRTPLGQRQCIACKTRRRAEFRAKYGR